MELGELLKLFLVDLQSLFRSRVGKGSLTLPQVLLLSSIPDRGIDMTSLALRLSLDNSTITRLVDVVVRRGWAEKKRSSGDRRVTLVSLTGTGERLQLEIEEEIDAFGNLIYQALHFEDRDEVKAALTALHWTVSKQLLKQN